VIDGIIHDTMPAQFLPESGSQPEILQGRRMQLVRDLADIRGHLDAFLLGKLNFHDQFRAFNPSPEGSNTKIVATPKSDKMLSTGVTFVAAPDFTIRRVSVNGQDSSLVDMFLKARSGIRR
jgi:hypothetical protein